MKTWQPMKDAPHDDTVCIILLLGETVPGVADVRSGSWIGRSEARLLGESLIDGGWLIWNSADDWFVVDAKDPIGWVPVPEALS